MPEKGTRNGGREKESNYLHKVWGWKLKEILGSARQTVFACKKSLKIPIEWNF